MNTENINSNNIFEKYLNEINKFPDLKDDEEKILFEKIKKGDEKAKERIINSYLKLVVNIAKVFHKNVPHVSLLDLISEGNIGLMKAIEKYDYKKGIKFSTYAAWWIKQRIRRTLNAGYNIVKIPSHIDELLRCFFKALNINKHVSYEDKIEAAKSVGIEIDKIEQCIEKGKTSISYNYSDNNTSCLEEILEDRKFKDPLSVYERRELFENLLKWLDILTEKEKKVIILRYGLEGKAPMTLEQIGNILNLTRERIRQIEENAINKLRFHLIKFKHVFDL